MRFLYIIFAATFSITACQEAELGPREKASNNIVTDFSAMKGKEFVTSNKSNPLYIKIFQVNPQLSSVVIETYYFAKDNGAKKDVLQKPFVCDKETCVSTQKEQGIFEYTIDFNNENLDEIILTKEDSRNGKIDSSTTYYLK